MIREYNKQDTEILNQMLNNEFKIIFDDDKIFTKDDGNIIYIYEKDKKIVGFSSFRRWKRNNNKGKFIIYVLPEYRNIGIGTELYNKLMDYIKPFDLIEIEVIFYGLDDNIKRFYTKNNFVKWYQNDCMIYNKGYKPQLNYEIVNYDDSFYFDYVNTMRNSFYDMRKENNFEPYYCVEFSDNLKKSLLEDKDNIYILKVNNKLVASASVHIDTSDMIGPLFVSKEYQGKGYGKAILYFIINEVLRRGQNEVKLEVVTDNIKAKTLYKSMGFEYVETMNSYRLFIK